jgi:hypothetical protein
VGRGHRHLKGRAVFLQIAMCCGKTDQDKQIVAIWERPGLQKPIPSRLVLPKVAMRFPQLHQGEPRTPQGYRSFQIWDRGSGESVLEGSNPKV